MPVKSPLSPVDIPEVAIHQAIVPILQSFGERIALIDGVTDKRYTYSMTLKNIKNVASGLHRLGVRKGDIVSLFAPNCPEWVFMFFGVMMNGATVTTVNPSYTKYELQHNMKDSDTRFIFTVEALRKLVMDAAKECSGVKRVIVLGKSGGCGCGCVNFDDILNDDGSAFPEDVVINPREDIATIPYSSGTTGLPKGVMITHHNIIAHMMQLGHPDLREKPAEGTPPAVLVAFVPFFHAYGMVGLMLGGLFGGSTVVTLPRFKVEQFLAVVEKYKVTYLPLVPPVVVLLNNSDNLKKYDLSSVKVVGSGAAPLAKNTELQFTRKLGVGEFKQGYGMTELTCAGSVHRANTKVKPGSCGVPLPNMELKVIDVDTGKEVGPNKKGEVLLKGPNVMKGYHNKPDATKNTIDEDGWLHTGDIGYYDEDSDLFIVDRLKELIKYKGFQVAPAELEAVLLNHPKVADVGVIGVPDREAGEVPRAYIMKKPGPDVTEQELKSFVAERLASFKHLRGGVVFVGVVPKSQSGKILRKELREMAKRIKSKL